MDINFYINEVLRLYWGGMSVKKAIEIVMKWKGEKSNE